MRYPLLALVICAHSLGQRAFEKGKTALDQHSYAEAESYLRQAELEAPAQTNALALRAKALIHLDRFVEAEECLQTFIHRQTHSPDGKYLLGYVQFRLGKAKESLSTFTEAAKLEPPSPSDLRIVGLDYVLLNDYPDAVQWLERSVAENPNDAESLYHLGRTYYVLNSFEKAAAAWSR